MTVQELSYLVEPQPFPAQVGGQVFGVAGEYRWQGFFLNPFTPRSWQELSSRVGSEASLEMGFLSVMLVVQQEEAGQGSSYRVSTPTLESRACG